MHPNDLIAVIRAAIEEWWTQRMASESIDRKSSVEVAATIGKDKITVKHYAATADEAYHACYAVVAKARAEAAERLQAGDQ